MKSLSLTCGWRGELFILMVTKPILLCFFFSPIFHLMKLFLLLWSVFYKYLSQRTFAPLSSEGIPLYFLWEEIEPGKNQNLGLGRTSHLKVIVELSSCCIFCGIGNVLKPTFSIAWAPRATPSFARKSHPAKPSLPGSQFTLLFQQISVMASLGAFPCP